MRPNRYGLTVQRLLAPGVSVLLLVLLVASIRYDVPNAPLRATVFAFYFVLTCFKPQWGYLFAIMSASWFEMPGLLLHYDNQFLIETGLIGVVVARLAPRDIFAIRGGSQHDSELGPTLLQHPYWLPLLCFSLCAGFASIFTYQELFDFAHGNASFKALLKNFFHMVFRWDVVSPFHGLSIATGYVVHVVFLLRLAQDWRPLKLHRESVTMAAVLGCCVCSMFAYAQYLIPKTLQLAHDPQITGTLQNGNHLSFLCTLCLFLLTAELLRQNKNRRRLVFYCLAACLILPANVLGAGKTAWLSCAVALVTIGIGSVFIRNRGRASVIKFFLLASSSVFAALLLCLGLLCRVDTIGNFTTVDKLFGEDRLFLLKRGWQFFDEHWITGSGLGNFFERSASIFDLHSQYFSVLFEQGLILLAILLLSMFYFFRGTLLTLAHQKESQAHRGAWFVILGAFVFIVIGNVFDFFLSYRSLLLVINCWALAVCFEVLPERPTSIQRLQKLSYLSLLVAGGVGLLTAFHPLTRPSLSGFYQRESEAMFGKTSGFTWSRPISRIPYNFNDCVAVGIKPVAPQGKTTFSIGLRRSGEIPLTLNIGNIDHWSKTGVHEMTRVVLQNGRWHGLCVCPAQHFKFVDGCNQEDKMCDLVITAMAGQYLSWIEGFSFDNRYVAFGQTEALPVRSLADAPVTSEIPCETVVR